MTVGSGRREKADRSFVIRAVISFARKDSAPLSVIRAFCVACNSSHPARRNKEHDVVDLTVRVEHPLAACIAMDGLAVLPLVPVCPMRSGRCFEENLESVFFAARRVLFGHEPSFISPCPIRAASLLRQRGRTRLAASQARSLDAEMNPTDLEPRQPKSAPASDIRLTPVRQPSIHRRFAATPDYASRS